jgi:hypothetical protein
MTQANKPQKCDVCGKRRVIVHTVSGGGHDDGDKYCRQCEDEYQGRTDGVEEESQ